MLILSKECELCHYWFFKDVGFKYEKYLCNGCHDVMQKAMSFNGKWHCCVFQFQLKIENWKKTIFNFHWKIEK